jgi:hypothetical protein
MIEMIVMMTGVAAMLGLCVVLLQLLMKLDADSHARLSGATSAYRLAEQFRRDVHGALSAHLVKSKTSPAEAEGLRLEPGADRAVEYQAKGAGIVTRVESRKGSHVRRERYEIPHTGAVRLSVKEEDGQTFAALAIDREAAIDGTAPFRAVEVSALVGKNQDRVSTAAGNAGEKP